MNSTPVKRTVTGAWIVTTWDDTADDEIPRMISNLHSFGVAKGTISKIETVFVALSEGKITPEQVTSLNAAYNLVKKPQAEFRQFLRRSFSDSEIQQLAVFVKVEARNRKL